MDGQCRNAFAIEAKVVGAEHALLGEVPVIFVVPRSGYAADAGKLLAFPRERLSAYKLPNAVRYIDEIPRTGSGKILRFARRFARIRGRGASLVQRVAVLKKLRKSTFDSPIKLIDYGPQTNAYRCAMSPHPGYVPSGVIPAVLLPFDDELGIDEVNFRKHLRDVATVDGISAITINAHSTEVASCSFDEQRHVLDIARDEVGQRIPLVNGVWADGSIEAARIARMAADGGAAALLVFPPAPFLLGQSPGMALAHFKRIADATELPIIVFQYPLATGQGYPAETLLRLCEEVPTIRAIKDWCGNLQQHEWHVRTLQNLPRPVNVLTTHSAWLLSSLVLGCNGLLSGSGSVIADLQFALFKAVRRHDLAEAQRLNDRIHALAAIFYSQPWADMHNRMKEALVLLGRLPRAVVRPPLVKLDAAQITRIRMALIEARLLGPQRGRDAA